MSNRFLLFDARKSKSPDSSQGESKWRSKGNRIRTSLRRFLRRVQGKKDQDRHGWEVVAGTMLRGSKELRGLLGFDAIGYRSVSGYSGTPARISCTQDATKYRRPGLRCGNVPGTSVNQGDRLPTRASAEGAWHQSPAATRRPLAPSGRAPPAARRADRASRPSPGCTR